MSHGTESSTPSIEQRARRRVALKTGFFIHALVFALVNAGLYLLANFGAMGGGHALRLTLPIWGWALGLAIHGLVVMVKLQGEGVRQRMIEREIESLKRQAKG